MTARGPAAIVAVHDGFYGRGTGAGRSNRAFLQILASLLAPGGGRLPGHGEHTFGCVPAGCPVTVQTVACPIARPRRALPPGAGAAPPAPAVLAALARQTLGLLSPVIRSSPAQNARAHLHQLQRGAAGRCFPGDGHDHLGHHLAGSRRRGWGAGAAVHDRRGGVPGCGSQALNTSGGT